MFVINVLRSLSEKKMAATVDAEPDLVASLLKTPFSRCPFGDKVEIIKEGRPTPKLDSLTKASSKGFVRHFKDCNYKHYEWLTASTELQAILLAVFTF